MRRAAGRRPSAVWRSTCSSDAQPLQSAPFSEGAGLECESPRMCRRLHSLKRGSHAQTVPFLPRSAPSCRSLRRENAHRARAADPSRCSARSQREARLQPETQRVWIESLRRYGARKAGRQLPRDGIPVARGTAGPGCFARGACRACAGGGACARRSRIWPRTAPTIWSSGTSPPRGRIGAGWPISRTSRRGGASSSSPVSPTPARAGSPVGGRRRRGRPIGPSMLWSRPCMTGRSMGRSSTAAIRARRTSQLRCTDRLHGVGISRSVGNRGKVYDHALAETSDAPTGGPPAGGVRSAGAADRGHVRGHGTRLIESSMNLGRFRGTPDGGTIWSRGRCPSGRWRGTLGAIGRRGGIGWAGRQMRPRREAVSAATDEVAWDTRGMGRRCRRDRGREGVVLQFRCFEVSWRKNNGVARSPLFA